MFQMSTPQANWFQVTASILGIIFFLFIPKWYQFKDPPIPVS